MSQEAVNKVALNLAGNWGPKTQCRGKFTVSYGRTQ